MVRQDRKPWVWIVDNDMMQKLIGEVKSENNCPTHGGNQP